MRGQDLWILLLYVGCGSASPYYYRESKHQSEHHKEYSYGGNGNSDTSGQIPESFNGQDVEVPQVSLTGKPERYSTYVYPSQASGYSRSYSGGGYSFGGGGSAQQYSSIKSAPLVSGEYSSFSSPVVMKQKIVRVYSYPSTSSQSKFYHFGKTGSGVFGSEDSIKPVQSERLVRHREESHYSQSHNLGGDDGMIGQKEPSVGSTWNGQSYGRESGLSEIHDDGQKTVEDDFDIGQEKESVHKPTNIRFIQSGHVQSVHHGHRERGDLTSSQTEESYGEFGKPVPTDSYLQSHHYTQSQREVGQEESLYQNPVKDEFLDLGQKQENVDELEIGQREEPISKHSYQQSHHHSQSRLIVGPKVENLYQKPVKDEFLDLGQKQENVDELEIGQREEPISKHSYQQSQHYSQSRLIVEPKVESLYQSPVKDEFLDLGQKQENIHQLEIGQREEPISKHSYQQSHHHSQSRLIVEPKVESLYQNPVKDEFLDLGQKQENVDELEIGQREEPISKHSYQQSHHHSQSRLIVEPKVESLYQNPVKDEFLDLGQKQENVHQLEIGQKEKLVPNQNYKQTQHYSYSHKIEVGKKEGSLYEKPEDEIGPKKESLGELEIRQREESVSKSSFKQEHHYSQGEGLQGEEKHQSLYNPNYKPLVGKKEEITYQDGHIELGKSEKPDDFLHKAGSSTQQPLDMLGQERERLDQDSFQLEQKPLALPRTIVVSTHKREESYQKHVGGNLEIGKKEVPILKLVPNDLNKKEGTENDQGKYKKVDIHDDFGQEKETESFSQIHKFAQAGQPSRAVVLMPVVTVGSLQPKPEYYGEHQQHSSNHQRESHGYHHGFSSQNIKPCEHGGNYQHGGFGEGQSGHAQQIRNIWERESSVSQQESNPEVTDKHYIVKWGHDTPNNRRQGIIYSSSLTKNNVTEVQSISPQLPLQISGKHLSSTQNVNLDKKVDELAKLIELDGISKEHSSVVLDNEQATTVPTRVHNAEIQELGTENFDIRSSLQPLALGVAPERKVKIYETHKEEVGYDYPSSQRSYTKQHSRHYSVREESHSGTPQKVEPLGEMLGSSGGQERSGSWYSSFSRHGYSSGSHGDMQGVVHHRVSRDSDRHASIDTFLSELDKDIARDNKKKGGQGGYVQVSQTQYSPSNSGSSSTPSGSSQTSSWFKKIGDNISSTYNKAKEKAKEIVSSVKGKMPSL